MAQTYFIFAGECSGNILGAELSEALHRSCPGLLAFSIIAFSFYGVGMTIVAKLEKNKLQYRPTNKIETRSNQADSHVV